MDNKNSHLDYLEIGSSYESYICQMKNEKKFSLKDEPKKKNMELLKKDVPGDIKIN